MAFSSRVETFTVASLPAWMTDGSTGTGSAVVGSGVLTLTAGDGSGQQGLVNSAATDQLDSFYCRMYPMPSEPLAVAMNFFDASFDGYGLGVGTSSNTPGDAELRVNKLVAGSLSHPDSETYSSTNHRWFWMHVSGSDLIFETAPDDGTGPGTWTSKYTVAYGTDNSGWDKDNCTLWLYSDPNTVDAYGNVAVIDGINGPTEAAAVSLTQHSFRWREDDGSETGASWAAALNTDISAAVSTTKRLRILIDAEGDPAALLAQMEWRKSGGTWAVLGQSPFPTIAAPTVTPFDSNATDHNVAMPATIAAGDLLLVLFSNDGSATVTNPNASKWRELFTSANSTNNRLSGYAAVADGTEDSSTVNFVTSTGERAVAQVYLVPVGYWSGDTADIIVGTSATGSDTAPNPPSATPDATRDWLAIACYGADDDDDASAYPTDYTIQQTYSQSGSGTEAASLGSAARQIRTGSAIDPAAFTIALTEQWVAQTILIPPLPHAFALAASSNITASGEATTAQLTAPAGKSSGSDFLAGRIQDDENPADSVNLSTDEYTEFEFCLASTADAEASAVYQFRITNNGTAIDTYTETPEWTISAAGVTGAGAATLAIAGAAAGVVAVQGAGSGAIGVVGAATGAVAIQGAGAGSLALTGSGTAQAIVTANASSAVAIAFTGTGTVEVRASGAGAVAVAAAGTGTVGLQGAGAGAVGIAGAAAGAIGVQGAGAAPVAITSSATGSVAVLAAGAGTVGLTGSGTGGTGDVTGAGAASVVIAGVASGAVEVRGAGAGVPIIAASASGLVAIQGAGAAAVPIAGAATGTTTDTVTGAGAGTLTFTPAATATVAVHGVGSGTIQITVSATGAVAVQGAGAGTIGVAGAGTGGVPSAELSGQGVVSVTGVGAGFVLVSGTGAATLSVGAQSTGTVLIQGVGAGAVLCTGLGAGGTGIASPTVVRTRVTLTPSRTQAAIAASRTTVNVVA